jgi:hypothetical protein
MLACFHNSLLFLTHTWSAIPQFWFLTSLSGVCLTLRLNKPQCRRNGAG